MKTPLSLLQRLRQNSDPGNWERFVDLYSPLLYFWACRMGLQANDAADLVQDVFAVVLEKLPAFQYDPSKSFRAWLKTVATNKWRDACRKKAAAPKQGGDAALDEVPAPPQAEAFWEKEYQQHLTRQALQLMQNEFQPSSWKAFWGMVVEGKPAAEVATELSLTPEAVYAAKARVLRRLRDELEGLMD